MSINQFKRKHLVRSPKPLVRKASNVNTAVESQYQLKTAKNTQRKEGKRQLLVAGLNESQRSRSGSTIKRKLSFRKQPLQVKVLVKQQKSIKSGAQQFSRQELAMAIEYCQPNNLKQNNNLKVGLQSKIQPSTVSKVRRVRRIRSNDSLLINRKSSQSNLQVMKALNKAKKQNEELKQLHFKSLKHLKDLEHQYAEQKTTFQKEEKYYLNKIEALRRKVEDNKLEIGHLFSYKNFDSAKLMIKPIVQVEGQSSLMRSLLNTSEFKQLNQISRFIPISSGQEKEEMTQKTGPTSRESCRDLEYV